MKNINILCLITIFLLYIKYIRADWEYIENESEDRASLGEVLNEIQMMYLDEEVEEHITIAYMTYTGDETPSVTFSSPSSGNSSLGLVFQQNSSYNNYWALVVTEKQDYESSMWTTSRRYLFDITANDTTFPAILNINNIDDNAPVLQAASDDTCTIPENYIGPSNCTYIITDDDGWINLMTYTINGTNNEDYFFEFILQDSDSVTNSTYEATLVLHTINELDYETRSIYFFSLIATDTANNIGRLRVYVEVEDMPDTPPSWTTIFASLQFDEKTSQSYSVNAIDGDIGLNWEINYWITTDSEWEEFFLIDNQTGLITINPIDRDALDNSIYYFVVHAYEVPDPTSTINQTVTVIVDDVNDNIPVITMSASSISIEENKTATLEINVTINDIDTGSNALYTVELLDETGMGYNEAFQIVPNQGYKEWTFYLSVSDSSLLDYEVESWQELSFQVYSLETQNSSHFDIQTLNVSLINWNDEYPIFESSEMEVTINETIGIDEIIAVVYAEDRDIGDTVTHALLGTAINRKLIINESTGEIKTRIENAFDYETSDEVIVQVRARDSMNDTIHSTVAQLTIYVLDINDETPSISIPSAIISIDENQENGTIINEAITATDADTTALLEFRINWTAPTTYATKYGQSVNSEYYENSVIVQTVNISEDSTGYVKAVLMVNEIIVDNTPDYELFDTLYLTLTVEDLNQVVGDGTATVVISIIINDLNDNAPVFTNSTIEANNTVTENSLAGTIIGTITATDADGVNYNQVSYSLRTADEETPEGWVLIDGNTGQLSVNESNTIDADIPIYYLRYTVIASDGTWDTEANISVYVIDTNDNVPTITSNLSLPFEIYEKSEDYTNVTLIEAYDADRDSPYNSLYYTLGTTDEEVFYLFMFDITSGLFYVNKRLNNELDRDFGPSSYTVSFTVSDNYLGTGITYTVSDTFVVQLLDINDQYPIIYNSSITTSENILQGECIGDLIAYDNDEAGTNNTKINFSILSIIRGENADAEPPEDMFSLHTDENYESQIASVCTNYDLEGYYGTYEVVIQTNDFGTYPSALYYNQTLDIVIDKYNFEAPTIIYPTNNSIIYLSKTQSISSQLYLYNGDALDYFYATDNQGGKWDIVFSVEEETNSDSEATSFFSFQTLRNSSARLILSSYPDFDTAYKLSVVADCGCTGKEPFTNTVFINIRFHDITAEPSFSSPSQNLSFYENSTGVNTSSFILEAFWNSDGEEWEEFPIYYVIESDSSDGSFELDPITRELTLISMLDREEIDSHTLTIQASQNPKGIASPSASARLTVYIEVLDVNDNPPHFNESTYFGGVTTSTTLGTVIVSLEAYDLDIDTLTYSIDEESLNPSDSSLSNIKNPFLISSSSGEIYLNFQVLASMLGYFTFDAVVTDLANHTDTTLVKIYIASELNRVTFTFENTVSFVSSKYSSITSILQSILGYVANIESIQASTDSSGNTVDTETDVLMHFIDEENNEVIEASVIQSMATNLVTFTELRSTFMENASLYLLSLADETLSTDNTETILKAWLIGITVVLFILCTSLTVAFVIKTRSLTRRLEKLTEKKFGSQDSGLNRIPVAAPGTNKNAVEGSNPIYNDTKKMPDLDSYSVSSGDSDLIGIEDNADFEPKPQMMFDNSKFRERF